MTFISTYTEPSHSNPRYVFNFASNNLVGGAGAQVGAVGRVFMSSVDFVRPCTIDQISCELTGASAGQNLRMGLYEPAASTLFDLAAADLVFEGSNISTTATGIKTSAISSLRVKQGMYYAALETSDATMTFRRLSNTVDNVTEAANEYLFGGYYTLGAYGSMEDPISSALTQSKTASFCVAIRIKSWG